MSGLKCNIYSQHHDIIIVMPGGGDKSTQTADIIKAKVSFPRNFVFQG